MFPQGLKPAFLLALDGVAEATPLQSIIFETSSNIDIKERHVQFTFRNKVFYPDSETPIV